MVRHCKVCGSFMSKEAEGWRCREHGFYPSSTDKKAIKIMVIEHLLELKNMIVPKKPRYRRTTDDGESLVLVWSDWHIGRKNVVNGKQVWDINTAKESVDAIMENVRDLFEKYVQKSHGIEDIHLFILGDIVDDEKVFAMHPYKIEETVIHQYKEATKTLMKAIKELALYGLPIFIHTKSGNHKDKDTPESSSWDNAVYIACELATQEMRDIHWDINFDSRNVATIRGHRYMIMHGKGAPSQVQTAAGRAKFGGWLAKYGFDVAVLGHYHHSKIDRFASRPIIYNGTMMVGDDYTDDLALDDSKPSQVMFGVSNKRPLTFWFGADTQ